MEKHILKVRDVSVIVEHPDHTNVNIRVVPDSIGSVYSFPDVGLVLFRERRPETPGSLTRSENGHVYIRGGECESDIGIFYGNGKFQMYWPFISKNLEVASDEQTELFFSELSKTKYSWDNNTLELKSKFWLPKHKDTYWYVSSFGVRSEVWNDYEHQYEAQSNGLCFKTEQETQEFFDKVVEMAKNRH